LELREDTLILDVLRKTHDTVIVLDQEGISSTTRCKSGKGKKEDDGSNKYPESSTAIDLSVIRESKGGRVRADHPHHDNAIQALNRIRLILGTGSSQSLLIIVTPGIQLP